MNITKKNIFKRLFCNHKYEEGIISKPGSLPLFNLSGDTYTTLCIKCGKIKSTRFVRNFDGS